MTEYYGPALVIIYKVIDLAFYILSSALIVSIIAFTVEPLNSIYSFLSRAKFDQVGDKKFFVKHCARIIFAMVLLLVIKFSSVAEYILVILERVTT